MKAYAFWSAGLACIVLACGSSPPPGARDGGETLDTASPPAQDGALPPQDVEGEARPQVKDADPDRSERSDGESVDAPAQPSDLAPDRRPDGAAGGDAHAETGPGTRSPDGSAALPAGACPCPAGYKVCGRCVRLDDPRFGCGPRTCSSCSAPQTIMGCSQGSCMAVRCAPGFADCNGDPKDGCEVDLGQRTSCGACGVACAADELCGPGGCTKACAPPLTKCGDRCVDLFTAASSCGKCGESCPGPSGACTAGRCGFSCPPGLAACPNVCTDLMNDAQNCGACGTECPTGPHVVGLCMGGKCANVCDPGYTMCGDACVNLNEDGAHCGACGRSCDGTCVDGACATAGADSLFSGGTAIASIAADEEAIFWSDTGTNQIFTMPRAGGRPQTLVPAARKPVSIVVDDCFVYWADNLGAAVWRVSKAGGAPSLVSKAAEPQRLQVDEKFVYWIDTANGGSVLRAPKAGGSAFEIVKPMVVDYSIDRDFIYYTFNKNPVLSHFGGIQRALLAEGEASVPEGLPGGTVFPGSIGVTDGFIGVGLPSALGATYLFVPKTPAVPVTFPNSQTFVFDQGYAYEAGGRAHPLCGGGDWDLPVPPGESLQVTLVSGPNLFLATPKRILRRRTLVGEGAVIPRCAR